ncbi:MAG: SprT-like domain-containing protein, partial [Sinomicrobium sp.]|nr:SprT-like domain-containing protein [Sinomicrobium sp.]
MHDTLKKYLPERAVPGCVSLITTHNVSVKIVNERVTRHGDYRRLPDGRHRITVNANLNRYRFLITFIHEIAHLVAYTQHGRAVKPHGMEWKRIFTQLMLPFMHPEIFPGPLLPLVARHFKNPRASSDTDVTLSLALKEF